MQPEWLDEIPADEEHDEEEREYNRWNAIISPIIDYLELLLSEPPPQLAERLAPIIRQHENAFVTMKPMDKLIPIWDAIGALESFLRELREEDPVIDWCVDLALQLAEAKRKLP